MPRTAYNTRRRAAATQLEAVLTAAEKGAAGDLWQTISYKDLAEMHAPFPSILTRS